MRVTIASLGALVFLLAACGGHSANPNSPAAVISVEAPIENPGEHGPYDAAWRVSLTLEPLDVAATGERIAPFMHGPGDLRLDALLLEREAGEPDVWHGRLHASGDAEPRGSFTITRQNRRVAGRIRAEEYSYSLEGSESRGFRLLRLDPEQLPPPGPPVVPGGDRDNDQ